MSDPIFVKEALVSGRVDKVLVESILAAEYLQKFNHPDIVLEEVKNSELAYGIALNGEAKRLTTCLKRYFKEHENQILLLLSKQLASAKVCSNSFKTSFKLKLCGFVLSPSLFVAKEIHAQFISMSNDLLQQIFYEFQLDKDID